MIDLLHSLPADPNALLFLNARNDEELKKITPTLRPLLHSKLDAITDLIEENENAEVKVSEKTVQFWMLRRAASAMMLDVVEEGDVAVDKLSEDSQTARKEYFSATATAWNNLKDVLLQLSKEIIGPYVLGAFLSFSYMSEQKRLHTVHSC